MQKRNCTHSRQCVDDTHCVIHTVYCISVSDNTNFYMITVVSYIRTKDNCPFILSI